MKTTIALKKVKVPALCVHGAALLALFCVCEIGRAEENLNPTEQAELLRLVANGWKANFESIRTWKGVAKITDLREEDREEGLVVERREADAHFAYDAESGARRWRWHYTLLENNKSGVVKTKLRGQGFEQTNSAMFKDGAYYRMEFWHEPSETERHTVGIYNADAPHISISDYGMDLDPLFFFRQNSSRTVNDLLELYINVLENPDAEYQKGISVERHGNIVTVKINTISAIYEYDLSKGCNLVRRKSGFTSEEKQRERTHTYEWQEKDGVYYPKGYSFTEHSTGKDAPPTVRKWEVVFEDVEVNEPFEESEFSLESLGVKPGDTISDRRTGASYVYGAPDSEEAVVATAGLDDLADSILDDEEPVEVPAPAPADEAVVASEPAAEVPPREPGRSAIIPAAVAGAVALLVIAVVVAVLRRRR